MPRHLARSMYVLAAKDGPVKIGSSANMQERWRQVQSHNFAELTLVYIGECEPGAAAHIEAQLHQCLARYRVRGEWYRLSAADAIAAIQYAAKALGHAIISAEIAAPKWRRQAGMKKGRKKYCPYRRTQERKVPQLRFVLL